MSQLQVAIGQYSTQGRKPVNQDFHGVMLAREPLLSTKGVTLAIADGISSSDVSQVASETAVKGFLNDYYATPESWSIKTAVQRVVQATNAWLYAQTRQGQYRYDIERGYVCTFSTLILKSNTAHLFHVGDARIYRLTTGNLEQLTEDHRMRVSADKSYLSRALGMRDRVEIDYSQEKLSCGDVFLLATDGVYEFIQSADVVAALKASDDLNQVAQSLVQTALDNGSDDNLTLQIVKIQQLPALIFNEIHQQAASLTCPPILQARTTFDGFHIQRVLHHSSRCHVYLAIDADTGAKVVLKTPALTMSDDNDYLERFLIEEWVCKRIDNDHVVKAHTMQRNRQYLYLVFEYIEGQTLSQWMTDNPKPTLEVVRNLVEQIAIGLRAMHRLEMLHQDLRPHNIMIDTHGTVKIIDLGSVKISGLAEIDNKPQTMLGTAQYTAPEYFIGAPASFSSDRFSLGVITYQLLSNRLPYGTHIAKINHQGDLRKLRYQTLGNHLPDWLDETLHKALHSNPYKRHDSLSEFIHDLRHPNPQFVSKKHQSWLERDPLKFFQGLSLVLLLIIIYLLIP